MTDTQQALRALIEARYATLPAGFDAAQDDLFAQRYIDSMALVRFICDVEAQFDVAFDDAEIQADRFRTVAGIAALIDAKRAG